MSKDTSHRQQTARLVSLDALRGLAILLMLLVNNFGLGSRTPMQLRHAGWEGGVHLADLAFPWFIYCVGVAITFSAVSAKRRGIPVWKYDLRVLRRTLILIILGAILDTSGDRKLTFFSVGVLQTIALSYLFSALLYELPVHRRLFFASVCLVGYWAAVRYLPVPGAFPGAFEENRNFIIHLNRTYLGQVGLWGLTRIIPTTALALMGTAIGDILRMRRWDQRQKASALVISGVLLTVVGFLWALSLPFNKPIWTPSYILLSAGTATLVLALFYHIADMRGQHSWTFPLVVFGSNAILAYVLPILVKGLVLVPLGIHIAGWLGVSLFTIFWWIVMLFLYRKRLFLKV